MTKNKYIEFENMADVCEYSHNLTIKICNALGLIAENKSKTQYTTNGQKIFDKIYDNTCNLTKI